MSNGKYRDEIEIRGLIENWLAAIRSEDLESILAVQSPDILIFHLPPPVFDLGDIDVTAGQNEASVTAMFHCWGSDANGKKTKVDGRLTIGLRKIKGRWTVMDEHHSETGSGARYDHG